MKKTVALDSKEPALPQAKLRDVRARTLLMFGDDDLVTIEHIEADLQGDPRRRARGPPRDLAFPAAGEAGAV
jgi:hypothetical protein